MTRFEKKTLALSRSTEAVILTRYRSNWKAYSNWVHPAVALDLIIIKIRDIFAKRQSGSAYVTRWIVVDRVIA